MKTYARLQNGQPIEYSLTEDTIRKRFKNVSFPANFVPPEGYVEVGETTEPEYDSVIQRVVEKAPILESGQWKQVWQVVSKFAEYKVDSNGKRVLDRGLSQGTGDFTTVTVAEQEAAARQKDNELKAAAIRKERDALLRDSDWTQFNDSPLSEEEKQLWVVYRQALRAVTEQSTFPTSVEWPAKP